MKSSILLVAVMTFFTSVDMQDTESWNKNPVIAHRGAWKAKGLPENSIAALNEAIRLGCYGSEFDVHMTADSVLVVNHDADFFGMKISRTTYHDLLAKKLSNGESIPTVEEYLKAGKNQKRTKMILEIKPSGVSKDWDMELAARSVALVKKLKVAAWVDYISFGYDILQQVSAIDRKARVAYLAGDVPLEKLKADGFYGADYHYSIYRKGEWFTKAKEMGLTINAWTVNELSDMHWLLENNVEFITTNEPELLLKTLASTKQ